MARINEHTDMATIVEIMEVRNALKGKRFSITGHLGRPRKEIVAIIEQAGGHFDKSPVWGTHFLITNKDWNKGSTITNGASRKLLAAHDKGIKIISEAKFYEMICESGETCADLFEEFQE
jgi:NAD-dependent DNA ligase